MNDSSERIFGIAGDPIHIRESVDAVNIMVSGGRRVTVVRPDGVAVQVWPAAPLKAPHNRRSDDRESDPTAMIGAALLALPAALVAFTAGALIF